MKFVNSPLGRQLNLRGINAKVIQNGVIRVGDLFIQKTGTGGVKPWDPLSRTGWNGPYLHATGARYKPPSPDPNRSSSAGSPRLP